MIHKKLVRHLLPHVHKNGEVHRAHGLSLLALFLYLQVLIIFTVGLYSIKLAAPQILGVAKFTAEQIVALTNAKRQANGLELLSFNPSLAQAAAAKARDMFAEDYWAHSSPTGVTPWSFITGAGYKYIFAGENLARDFTNADSTVEAWMNSPSHRSNLLDKNFKEIGVAVASGKLGGGESTLVVQMFGTSVSPTLASQSENRQKVGEPAQIGQVGEANFGGQVTVLATQKFSIARIGSLVLVGIVFALFVLEVAVTMKRSNLHLKSGIVAHLLFLAFVLVAVWYSVGGAII